VKEQICQFVPKRSKGENQSYFRNENENEN